MPGTTTPDGIVYPVVGDKMSPLASWFAGLANTTQTAITTLRTQLQVPEYPAPLSGKGADQTFVPATVWSDLPNMPAQTLTLERPCWVSIVVGGWIVATAGDTRVSARVTGATTLGESQLQVGGDSSSWGQVMYIAAGAASGQASSNRIVRLNAGTNTIQVRAYGTGGGTHMSNYTTLQVTPVRWA